MANDERIFVTASDLAKRFRVTPAHIRQMAARGELPRGLHFGRCVRWDAAIIDTWLNSLQAQAGATVQGLN